MIQVSDHWFGTPQSLLAVLDAQAAYRENPLKFTKLLSDREDGEAEGSPLLQVHEGVAVVQINGPLTSQESWLDEFFGLTSYPALSRAVLEAADRYESGEVHSIIHAFSTPGGDASGINGATEVMQAARERAPDTISYTASHALSAGYWLASINNPLRVDRMGEVGSIGVVSTVRTIHRMLEEDGIDIKVIRSGRYKALLSPYEPFSEAGLKMVEEKGHELHRFFTDHILSARPGLGGQRLGDWAEGQTFFGARAIEMGLADGPATTLNALIAGLIEKDRASRPTHYTQRDTQRGQSRMSDDTQTQEPEVSAPTEDQTQTQELEVLASAEDGLSAYLKEEVATLKAEITAMRAELSERDRRIAQLSEAENAATLLGPIVIQSIHWMQAPLGQAPLQLKGLPPEVLASQYKEVRAQFTERFPVGQHSLTEADDSRVPIDLAEQRLLYVNK